MKNAIGLFVDVLTVVFGLIGIIIGLAVYSLPALILSKTLVDTLGIFGF